jgi:hypothetical protein
MTVCVTGTVCQYRGRKHSEDSRTPEESLINKSMNNSRPLDSNLFNNRSLPFSYPSCDIFYLLSRLKLCFDKMNIVCLCLGNTATSEFYTPTFQDTFRCRGITQKEAYIIENRAKGGIKNEPYLSLQFS